MSPLILGGGPAGSSAAIRLAAAGCPVTVIERTVGPHHKVCGDFLSGEIIGMAAVLGVDLARFAPAAITRVRLVHGRAEAVAALPFPALGLSREVLDEALLVRAAEAGARVLRGHAVRRLRRTEGGFAVEAGALGEMQAGSVFLATGKHDLRGAARPQRGGLVGLKTYVALRPDQRREVEGSVELVLFPGGYAGLQPVEAGRAALCWVLPAAALRRLGAWPAALEWLMGTCPHLARRLAGARLLLDRPVAVAGIPYGYLHHPGRCTGVFRLGDQAGVIPSLSGDGVAIALHSGRLAAEAWLSRDASSEARYHRRLRGDLVWPMRVAGLTHLLCRSWAMQSWTVSACRHWPGLLRRMAAATRVAGGISDVE